MVKRLWIVPLLLLLAVGCAGMDLEKVLDTPEKQSAFFMGYYLQQRQSYEQGVKDLPTMPESDQRHVLRETLKVKKRFLEEFGPAAKAYDQYVQQGQMPTVQMETALWDMYRRLQEDLR